MVAASLSLDYDVNQVLIPHSTDSVVSKVNALLSLLRTNQALALVIGISIGAAVIFLLRASQVWRFRQAYGFSTYQADSQRTRLIYWGVAAFVIAIPLLFSYFWWVNGSERTTVPGVGSEEQLDPLADARIYIPRLAIEAPLVQAPIVGSVWDVSRLGPEVAHLQGTAYPGDEGNVVLAGHVTIPGSGWGPFQDLHTLQAGDRVFIESVALSLAYEVTENKVVEMTSVEIAYPTPDSRLTLITCTGWDDSTETYLQRVVIVARLIDSPDLSSGF